MNDLRDNISDDSDRNDDIDTGAPISQLMDYVVAPDPELSQRVRRGINRKILAADGLDLSLNLFVQTAWQYVLAFLEILPLGAKKTTEE